ncbi:3-oxoacyl-[acyl-carrier protein] reductase [Variovorax sp. OK605]|uniref:SDR family NAD(P)-dependent oxidoreductase n=1 Tax=Variovorax sp. OK605 TaxID=1855317 RepID=UPI0008F2C041|nr:SDR family oxidoreductase [Variovorax sp. OK605]SFP57243.1 3-oxoacyl-[acyl-carrier protein] reductase [Variovorax sp. OK605]
MTEPAVPVARRLLGTVCVVTGAARGIGLAIAERFAAEGGRIACLDVGAARLDTAVQRLRESGAEVRGYTADVGRRESVAAAFEAVERDFGAPVGVLVNNAVWARFQPLADVDEESVGRMFDVGLKGLIWTTQAVAPQMKRRGGGAIVNLSSTSALQALTHSIAYAAMKAGVLGLTRASAVELSPHGIRVNAIVPGMVGTPASVAQFDEATVAARLSAMPLGRFGEPGEIASVAAFLASDDSRYVQGAEIVADGGWTIATR